MASTRLFLLVAKAVAAGAPGYLAGNRHGLLIYVKGNGLKSAQAAAVDGLSVQGWQDVQFERGAEVSPEPDLLNDPQQRAAAQWAIERGVGVIVYAVPIPNDS